MNALLQKHGCANVFNIPEGLKELMSDISREVLRDQPDNILDYIANYLSSLLITREHGYLAVKILEDLCDCKPTLEEMLISLGMSKEQAKECAIIIHEHIENFDPVDVGEKFKEKIVLKKLMAVVDLDLEQASTVCKFMQNAYRDYWQKRNSLQKVISSEAHQPWEIAAQRTIDIYKKTCPTYDELVRATEVIQAAYRGYHVRRHMLGHIRTNGEHAESVTTALDIAGSREINLGPKMNLRIDQGQWAPGYPGMAAPGVGEAGMLQTGMGSPGFGQHPGIAYPGMGTSGVAHPGLSGFGQPGFAQPGMGQPGMGVPGFAQPGMGQPGMWQPGMWQPGMWQPGMGEPGLGQPGMGQPGMWQPGMGQPGMGQPGVWQPGMGQPELGQSAMGEPGIGYPGMGYPGMGAPGFVQPGMGQPVSGQIGMGQPVSGQIGMGQPGMGQPGMGQPGMGQPGMGQPGMGQPGMGQLGMGQPGMGQPGMGQPGMGKPGMGQPGMGQLGMGQPGIGHPGMGQPGMGQDGMGTLGMGKSGEVQQKVWQQGMEPPGPMSQGVPSVGQDGMGISGTEQSGEDQHRSGQQVTYSKSSEQDGEGQQQRIVEFRLSKQVNSGPNYEKLSGSREFGTTPAADGGSEEFRLGQDKNKRYSKDYLSDEHSEYDELNTLTNKACQADLGSLDEESEDSTSDGEGTSGSADAKSRPTVDAPSLAVLNEDTEGVDEMVKELMENQDA